MTTARILIVHKDDNVKPSKVTKVALAASADRLATARVRRPGIETFFESGAFAAMTAVPQSVIDNPLRRRAEFPDAYYIVNESDMGRAPKTGERDWQSTAQSILLWIKKYYAETEKPLVRVGELSVIVEYID